MSGRAAEPWLAAGAAARWAERERFTMLVIGEAGVEVFLSAWSAWRSDARRCGRLDVILLGASLEDPIAPRDALAHHRVAPPAASVEPGAPRAARVASGARSDASGSPEAQHDASAKLAAPPATSIETSLQALLAAAWPPLTPDLHRLSFDDGGVQLLFSPGDAAQTLRDLVATVDAFVIDAHGDEMSLLSGEPRHAKAIARLAASDARLTAARLDPTAEQALVTVGFRFDANEATPASATIRHAHFSPHFAPRRAVRESARLASAARALIVGGGLAGCATAWALAESGWRSTLIERRASIADAASGNPAGLFHGIVNGQDGSHARFNRAAALEAHVAAAIAIRAHRVAGGLDGLLQLVDADTQVDAMRALLGRLRLPAGYVQALAPEAASAHAGLSIARPAWFYPGGGWIAPRGLARSFIERADTQVEVVTDMAVATIERADGLWHVLDAAGRRLASAAVVVLAGGGESLRLLGGAWPVEPVRGQISSVPVEALAGGRLPGLPLTGAGFLLPEVDGRAIFGATADAGDPAIDVRPADHDRNRLQLLSLVPSLRAAIAAAGNNFEGRAATRWVSRDRLPLIGKVPRKVEGFEGRTGPPVSRPDTPRRVERQEGLYLFTALGSRGITWAALGARVIAASISGAPLPLGARLLDAIDPARFAVRERQRPQR